MKKNNSLLIVVDMQNDFINGALGTKEAGNIVDNVVTKINSWKDYIVATQDTHYSDTYSNTREGKYLPIEHCIKDSFGWKINAKVQKALEKKKAYPAIQKNYFTSIDSIPELVKTLKINKIELIGLCTDICVISNALYLKSLYPEIDIAVDSKCCAGVTPETHEAALKTMKMCQIDIL